MERNTFVLLMTVLLALALATMVTVLLYFEEYYSVPLAISGFGVVALYLYTIWGDRSEIRTRRPVTFPIQILVVGLVVVISAGFVYFEATVGDPPVGMVGVFAICMGVLSFLGDPREESRFRWDNADR